MSRYPGKDGAEDRACSLMNTSASSRLPIPVHDLVRVGETRWVWSQHWLNVLFLHWRTPVPSLVPLVPAALEIETWEGTAWVSLVLFRLKVRPRWLPFIPGLSNLVEVNLHTYVRRRGRSGIYFLRMWADNRWAIHLARRLTPLPYAWAALKYGRFGRAFHFHGPGLGSPSGEWSIVFQPTGEGRAARDGPLDCWLLERYRLYVDDWHGDLSQADVAHAPWPVRDVRLSASAHFLGGRGLELSRPPDAAHYSAGVWSRFSGFYP